MTSLLKNSSIELQNLATNIRLFRARKNITQDQFSKLAKLSVSSIINIESCKCRPTFTIMLRLSEAMNLSCVSSLFNEA